jgi:hypothetical protein
VGAATWLVLVALLAGEDRATRAQVAVAVTLATGLEYLLSVVLGFYDYRLHNVPAYVPPGHGLVYLAAIALARRAAALPTPRRSPRWPWPPAASGRCGG